MKKNLVNPEAKANNLSEEELKKVSGGKHSCDRQENCPFDGILDVSLRQD